MPFYRQILRISPACIAIAFLCPPPLSAIDDPDYSTALSHLQTGEWDQSLRTIEASLESTPDPAKFLELKGRVLTAQEKYEDAIATLRSALEKNPQRFTVHSHLGEAYFRQGDWTNAFANFRIHAESDPPAVESRLKMIYCLCAVENYAAAHKLGSTLDPVDTYSPVYYFGRAAIAHFNNHMDDYENALRQVRTIYGNDTFNTYMPDLLFLMKTVKSQDHPPASTRPEPAPPSPSTP